MATTPKAARLTAAELDFLHKLLPHFPEYRSESQFLHTATMLGLWLLAVEARRPGLVAFGGYEAADVVFVRDVCLRLPHELDHRPIIAGKLHWQAGQRLLLRQ